MSPQGAPGPMRTLPLALAAPLVLLPLAVPDLGEASSANGVACKGDAALDSVGTRSGTLVPGEVEEYNIVLRAHSFVVVQAAYTSPVLHTISIRFSSWIGEGACVPLCQSGEVVICQPRQTGLHTVSLIGRGSPGAYTMTWATAALPPSIDPPIG